LQLLQLSPESHPSSAASASISDIRNTRIRHPKDI
jgi:hypothetical protein